MSDSSLVRRFTQRRWLGLSLAVGALALYPLAGLAQAPADKEQPAELVKAAQAEGKLMIYSSSDENQSKTLLAAFEKKYGIKGSYIRFPTGPLMQRFSTEYDAKSVQADIVSVSSSVPYGSQPDRFAKMNRNMLPNLAKWPNFIVNDNYMAWTSDLVGLAYNTDMLKPGDVPNTWSDLADPKWKGKFLLTDPQVADNYLGWLDAVETANGPDLLRKLAAQNYKVTQSGASGAQMVAAGAYAFNAPTFASFSAKLIEKKAPIALKYLKGPMVVSPRMIAIVANAPHPNAARLYINWLLSEDALKLTCSISPTSLAVDQTNSHGCTPVEGGVQMRFDVPAERKAALAKALGVAN